MTNTFLTSTATVAEYGRLSAEYAVYIMAKLTFQVAHRDIDGTISVEKYLENHKNSDLATLCVLVQLPGHCPTRSIVLTISHCS